MTAAANATVSHATLVDQSHLDTRDKIITPDAAGALGSAAGPAVLVTGHFDVLLAAHAHELACERQRTPGAVLIVAVTPPAEPVLSPAARAEMVAALDLVDYVLTLEEREIGSLLASFAGKRIVRLEAAHQQRMRDLIEHVHRRQSC
ncbi:MAG TPA: hypothetical protein VMU80_11910 [Bryobacteraceae bacterium]|nr:hypothetical protein [Bryobacteraceae bacterium]